MSGLAPGTSVRVRSRCVVEDGLLDAAMPWSPIASGVAMTLPSKPRPPVVSTVEPTSLVVQLHNSGLGADPGAVAVLVECNGVVQEVALPSPAQATLTYTLTSLSELTLYTVRHKCIVRGEAGLDDSIPWSDPVSVNTPSIIEVTIARLERTVVRRQGRVQAGICGIG